MRHGDAIETGDGIGGRAEDVPNSPPAEAVGDVDRQADEEDAEVGPAADQLRADELVATPDVVPVLQGDEDQIVVPVSVAHVQISHSIYAVTAMAASACLSTRI